MVIVVPAAGRRHHHTPSRTVGPFFGGVGRCDVAAEEEFHRGLPVAEHVIRNTEPRLEVLELAGPVLSREHQGGGDEDVRPDLLLREVVAEVLEAEAALQGEPAQRPAILSVEPRDVLLLLLRRCLICVHRELIWDAVLEVVLELLVVIAGVGSHRAVDMNAETKFRGVRPGDVGERSLEDVGV